MVTYTDNALICAWTECPRNCGQVCNNPVKECRDRVKLAERGYRIFPVIACKIEVQP